MQGSKACAARAGRKNPLPMKGFRKIAGIGTLTRLTIFCLPVTKTVSLGRTLRPGEAGSRIDRSAL